ncbi:hypothetical protein BC832DRAFT_568209, partial [Gaertneriomyces semiglobifer]
MALLFLEESGCARIAVAVRAVEAILLQSRWVLKRLSVFALPYSGVASGLLRGLIVPRKRCTTQLQCALSWHSVACCKSL